MVFSHKKSVQPEDNTFAKLDGSCNSMDFDMDDRVLVRGRETSDGTERKSAEKRRSRSRSAVRKLASVFTGGKITASSSSSSEEHPKEEPEAEKEGGFVPPSAQEFFQTKTDSVKTEGTAEDENCSVVATNECSTEDAAPNRGTFDMDEMPIRSPTKGGRWRSHSRQRGAIDRKLAMGSAGKKEVDDEEGSHHGSVVASVVSMFEFISPKKTTKKLSAEAPAAMMMMGLDTSSPDTTTEKKGFRNWIPKSPARRAKEAAKLVQEREENDEARPRKPSILPEPSMTHLDIKVDLMNDGDDSHSISPRRRSSANRSSRHSVMHRRRRSRTPDGRRSKQGQEEEQSIDDLESSQLSLLEAATVVTTVSNCSEAVALPPNAFGRNDEAKPSRPRVCASPSILKSSHYGSGGGNKEAAALKTEDHPSRGLTRQMSEYGTSSSGQPHARGSDPAEVSPVKKGRKSVLSSEGGESRRRGRSKRPSESTARRSSVSDSVPPTKSRETDDRRHSALCRSAHTPAKSPRPENRRKSIGSCPDPAEATPPHSPPKSSRHGTRPSSRGRAHGSSGTTDGLRHSNRGRSTGRHSVHARRAESPTKLGKTPETRRKSVAMGDEKNLPVAPLTPGGTMRKEFSKEAQREIVEDVKRGRESGEKLPGRSRHRSKSGHRKSPSKASRKKVEAGMIADSNLVKVRLVKKHRHKDHAHEDIQAAQLQIEDASESVLDVEFKVQEVQ